MYGIGKLVSSPPPTFFPSLPPDNGELFTWGREGPHLGYEAEGTKQLRPRRVDFLSEDKVTQVACGKGHTLGGRGRVASIPRIKSPAQTLSFCSPATEEWSGDR